MKPQTFLLILTSMISVTSSAHSQDRKCAAFETQREYISREESRIKEIGDKTQRENYTNKENICNYLSSYIKLNASTAKIFRKCVDEGFPGFGDAAVGLEQEIRQVYQPTAARYGCQINPD